MKIVCLVKLVPDVENFRYDYERHVLIRNNVHQLLNPEDATALAVALQLKQEFSGTVVETVTMGPRGAAPHLEDLVRRGVDRATLICDAALAGSDTYATSRVLARRLAGQACDCIFSGTHTLDGGTSHVPAQVADALGLVHMAHIGELHHGSLANGCVTVEVDSEDAVYTFEIDLPAVLGFSYSTTRKLPYISYENINRDVSDRITVLTCDDLGLGRCEVGFEGSLTKVARVEVQTLARKNTLVVRNDDEGIEAVHRFLKKKGFLGP